MPQETQLSLCKSLFLGDVLEEILFPFPELNSDEADSIRSVRDSLSKLRGMADSAKLDREAKFPRELLSKLGEMGLMGLTVPDEYGGMGFSNSAYVRLVEELAQFDSAVAVTLGGHQSIGYKALTLFGTPEQKEKYYSKLASGELLACFALTEPSSGSDAGSIKARAKLSADGKHFILNGEKIWITNAGFATFATVFAMTEEPSANGGVKDKMTAFFLELPAQGVTVGPPEDKMGLRGSWTGSISFEDVLIPAENVILGRGKGFKVAMEVLNNGRLGLAGGSTGVAKELIRLSVGHASQRRQFGKSISEFGLIQEKISQMVVETFVAESMVYFTTDLMDRNRLKGENIDYSLESAIAKVYATESLWRTANEALQIHGGMGYMRECPVEQHVRDVRANMIFEGTNEILRLFLALSGLQGPGQELADVAKAIRKPLKRIGVIKEFAAKQVRLNVLGGSKLSRVHSELRKEAGIFEDLVGEFAVRCSRLLYRHGKQIADRQLACKRVSDVLIDLFGMACVLSRVTSLIHRTGTQTCAQELSITRSFFLRASRRIRENLAAFDSNDDHENEVIALHHCETKAYSWNVL